jgi:class 3 adenylate cyclase
VLFTDIVGSTERLVALGDRRWREVREQHKALTRREFARYGGHEVDSVGDGFFATFDSPASAIRCACAIRDAVKALGIEVRAGVHAGEVEPAGEEFTGLTVHIGVRVTQRADPGEVLVSSIVKDLVAGSGIRFTDRGTYTLRGLPGEWQLFAPDVSGASSPSP